MSNEELLKRIAIINEGCFFACQHGHFDGYGGYCYHDLDDKCNRETEYPFFELNKERLEKEYGKY